jgi:hypothetical protein
LLTLAGNEGRIQLVLRNGSDHGIEKTNGRQLAELFGRGKPAKRTRNGSDGADGDAPTPRPRPRPVTVATAASVPPAVVAAPPPPPPDEIVTFRGTVRAVEVINSRKH